MQLLWPDLELEVARNNLHQVVHLARRVLQGHGDVGRAPQWRGEMLILEPPGGLWVDVEAFEAAAATARNRLDMPAYRSAIALYAGDLLPEDRYEDWTLRRREELRELHLALLVELARLQQAAGELANAIDILQRVVGLDPAPEEAQLALMRMYDATGRRQQALRQYERLRAALRRELAVEPAPATRGFREQLLAGRPPTDQAESPAACLSQPVPSLPTLSRN